ncbi:MAG: DUF342 domain-containing protein [Lachnospiraceae bacterium]|nr:DUF342 domain-containing protein [Lachnospiraceae bacterium]
MADFEDDDLASLFGDGDDLLSLLDSVQDNQNSGKTISAISTASPEEVLSSAAGSSEDAFQKLLDGLSDEESSLMEGSDSSLEMALSAASAPKKSMDEYDKTVYGFPQLDEIEKGIKRGLDVSFYDSADLTFRQMREIRIGLEQGLDVSYFCSKYFKDTQMREIRIGLMEGLDVGEYARLIYSLPDMERKHQELLRRKYQKDPSSLDFLITDYDTGMVIYTLDNLMTAHIQIKKPLPKNYGRKNLQNLLKIYGIVFGLTLDEIDIASLKAGEEVVVARGEESLMGEDGWYEYTIDNLEEGGPHLDENGGIDYMAQRQYCYVQPGQKVATYHPATQGKIGHTVKGMELPASSGKNLPRLALDKIRLLDDSVTYVSKKEGMASLKNGIINIVEQLEFKEDLGYGKNIKFDGDILIRASVLESAIVQAGGDIIVEGFVESAILKAGKDIILRKGCNADGKGELEAGGNIVAAFFENANVTAGGNVEANYILNSNICAGNKVLTKGSRSLISGGRVMAGEGVECGTVGNKFQLRTVVEVGSLSEVKEKSAQLYRRRKELEAEMEKVRVGMAAVLRKVGALNGRTNPIYLKFQDVLEQQKLELRALNEEAEKADEEVIHESRLFIKVENTAFENSKLCINGISRILKQDVVRARFFARGREIAYDNIMN